MASSEINPSDEGAGGPSGNRALLIVLIAVIVVIGVPAIAAGVVLLGRSDSAQVVAADKTGSDDEATQTTSASPTTEANGESQTTSPDGGGLDGASTSPTSIATPVQDTSFLTEVREGHHDGFDRITFEFQGAVPGFRAEYLDQLFEDGSGDPVTISGTPLQIVFAPASGVDLGVEDYTEIYTGPKRIQPEAESVREIVLTGDFEGQMTWGIGVRDKLPFRITTLQNPSRVVVDFESN
ncbi:MAG: hypothetical protein R2735_07300 [Microthrixaceae bacterium]